MKRISILIAVIFLVVSCKSKKIDSKPEEPKVPKIMVVTPEAIDQNQQNKAFELGKRVLMTCNTSKFKRFDETEVTQSVMEHTTIERLTKTCVKFNQWYGPFIDLKLDGVYKTKDETIYRYRALYTKKVANKELRVSVNEDNLVSAIKSLDWDESFDKELKE